MGAGAQLHLHLSLEAAAVVEEFLEGRVADEASSLGRVHVGISVALVEGWAASRLGSPDGLKLCEEALQVVLITALESLVHKLLDSIGLGLINPVLALELADKLLISKLVGNGLLGLLLEL